MDLLALPEDVLYEVIGTLPLMDRLRMRKTCRAFASLIADSHFSSSFENTVTISATLIDHLEIEERDTWYKPDVNRKRTSEIMVRISLGELYFKPISLDDMRVLELIQGLFRSCKVEKVNIHLRGSVLTVDYLRTLIGAFKIQEMIIHASVRSVSIALDLFKYFPTSKHCLVFNALPSRIVLFSLPPLHHLKLTDVKIDLRRATWALNSSDLTRLLSTHKNVTCAKSTASVSARELKELTQIIAKSTDRSVTISVHHAEANSILTQFDFSEKSKKEEEIHQKDVRRTIYSNCIIELYGKRYETLCDIARCKLKILLLVRGRARRQKSAF